MYLSSGLIVGLGAAELAVGVLVLLEELNAVEVRLFDVVSMEFGVVAVVRVGMNVVLVVDGLLQVATQYA